MGQQSSEERSCLKHKNLELGQGIFQSIVLCVFSRILFEQADTIFKVFRKKEEKGTTEIFLHNYGLPRWFNVLPVLWQEIENIREVKKDNFPFINSHVSSISFQFKLEMIIFRDKVTLCQIDYL